MGNTSVAKIKSFTDSIVVDGKNAIQVQIEWEDKGSGYYQSECIISIGKRQEHMLLTGPNGFVGGFSFTIPVDWLSEIPASSIDSGKITIENINMSTLKTEQITKRFIVYVPEEFKPEISNLSVSILDTKNRGVDYALYGLTHPEMRAIATPHPTSPIKRWRITGGGINTSGDFSYINGIEKYNFLAIGTVIRTWANTNFTLTIEDERGRTASITSDEFYIQSYNRPLINSLSAYRTDKDGIAKADGGYIKVTVNAAMSPIKDSNETEINSLKCYVLWKEVNSSSYYSDEITNNESYIFEANKDLNFEIKCEVQDKYMQTVAYCNVIGDSKDLNIVDGGGGAAIGTKATKGYFDVAYNSRFQKGISANEGVSSKKGFVSTGTGSKGDFLSFGEATRIYTMYHTVTDEETGSSYIVVDSWGDFNDCTDIGLYGVYYSDDVSTSNYYKVMNAPCEKAGSLRVYNSTGNMDKIATEKYLMQEYVTYDGSAIYRRCLSKIRDDADVEWPLSWTFGSWYSFLGTKV